MSLLSIDELGNLAPFFKTRVGNNMGRALMRVLSMDKVNDLYVRHLHERGVDFTRAILDDIGVRYEILDPQVLESLPNGPFIVVSNHPYGSIDGLMLLDIFGRLRPDFKVMVNEILGRIKPLEDNFICVTPTGTERTSPTKESLRGIKEALLHVREGHALGIFPSGAVSDLSLRDGCIRDREWQEPILRLIKKMNVPVVPVHFIDRNSNFYYMLGLLGWRVRLLRLPSEVFNKRGKRTRLSIGAPIMPQQFSDIDDLSQFGAFLRHAVYTL